MTWQPIMNWCAIYATRAYQIITGAQTTRSRGNVENSTFLFLFFCKKCMHACVVLYLKFSSSSSADRELEYAVSTWLRERPVWRARMCLSTSLGYLVIEMIWTCMAIIYRNENKVSLGMHCYEMVHTYINPLFSLCEKMFLTGQTHMHLIELNF